MSGPSPTPRLVKLHKTALQWRKRAMRALRQAKVAEDKFKAELKAESERQGVEVPE